MRAASAVPGAAGGGDPRAGPAPAPRAAGGGRAGRAHAAHPALRRVVLHQPLHAPRPLRQAPRRAGARLPRPPAPRQPPGQPLRPAAR